MQLHGDNVIRTNETRCLSRGRHAVTQYSETDQAMASRIAFRRSRLNQVSFS